MPYSDTDEDYDLGNGPPMSRQVYDWYQKNASPIGDQLTNRSTLEDMARQEYGRRQQNPQRYAPQAPNYPLQPIANIPSNIINFAGNQVAAPALKSMNETYQTDWSQQPFIGIGEQGEFTGRLPALAGLVTPYLAGGAPGGSATLPAGVKLPGKLYGYPEGLEGGYHGTPHTFAPEPENVLGRFRNEAIGTGEGHQTYAYGHYVGGARGTGVNYLFPHKSTESVLLEGKPWIQQGLDTNARWNSGQPWYEEAAHAMLLDAPRIATKDGFRPDVDSVIEKLQSGVKGAKENISGYGKYRTEDYPLDYYKENLEHNQKMLDFVQANKDKFSVETSGGLYHAEIKPPEEALMHWDKPLKDQPEIMAKMTPIIEKYLTGQDWQPPKERIIKDWTEHATAGEAYNELRSSIHRQELFPEKRGYGGEAVSEEMLKAGIPGVRYADQYSRPLTKAKEDVTRISSKIEELDQRLKDIGTPKTSDEYAHKVSIQDDIDYQKVGLKHAQDAIRENSVLHFDGKPIKEENDIRGVLNTKDLYDSRPAALTSLHYHWDIDTAIRHLRADADLASSRGPNHELGAKMGRKAADWLDKNRDKASHKENDITHNYVIFDPKDLNLLHREKNVLRGVI